MIYDLLAPIYDVVNGDIDYSAWADFIERIVEKEGIGCRPELVLDLGCGTGSMTIELAKRGYDMTRIIRECKPYCQGVHIMALGWESKVPALLELAGL